MLITVNAKATARKYSARTLRATSICAVAFFVKSIHEYDNEHKLRIQEIAIREEEPRKSLP